MNKVDNPKTQDAENWLMAEIAVAQVAYDDSVAARLAFEQRARAGDLHVVGMARDRKYRIHIKTPPVN